MEFTILIISFFAIATFYSYVGLGGGSSYLAVLALVVGGIWHHDAIRTTALICNIAVVSTSLFGFEKSKEVTLKRMLPFVILSVPAAYLGGIIKLDTDLFYVLLGAVLVLAGLFTFFQVKNARARADKSRAALLTALLVGGVIGGLSGLVGIGGGIFLAPVLYILHWDTPKNITRYTAFFILINSLAGLIGRFTSDGFSFQLLPLVGLAISVMFGAFVGSRLNNKTMRVTWIRSLTAILIVVVGLSLLWERIG